ncbi:hypothetical protein HYV80_04200 [Candidatus Woesearchaeota archaeon]|nr:hypothetical protein [Candidatus Woesearchaeota archaeon]
MVEITENGKMALKLIFTDFLTNYNSYNLKDKIGLSNAGSLKLLRNLSEKNLLTSEKMGNAIFYRVSLSSQYALKLLELIFLDYSNLSSFVKGWIYDLQMFKNITKSVLLFGSILKKGKEAKDVDVCFMLKHPDDYSEVQIKVAQLNSKSRLKIHPLYLTEKDFEKKLMEKDKPLIDIVKSCVVVHGHELFVRILKNVQS